MNNIGNLLKTTLPISLSYMTRVAKKQIWTATHPCCNLCQLP